MHGSMSAAGGDQASRLDRAAPAPPADPTTTLRSRDTCFAAVSLLGATRVPAARTQLYVDRPAAGCAGSLRQLRRPRWSVRWLSSLSAAGLGSAPAGSRSPRGTRGRDL